MMITIYGLPPSIKYADLKILIKQKCNISDFILASMACENDGTKKVRVGLADDGEGNHLIKCLDGYRVSGNVIRLVPVAKSSSNTQEDVYDSRDSYQQRSDSNKMPERSGRSIETPRPAPWLSNNHWTAEQTVQPPVQNTYNYSQQPINAQYGNPINQQVKPQFEEREIPMGHRPQQNQGYPPFPQKSNLISLGPERHAQPTAVREVPQGQRPVHTNRYTSQQNYDMPEKPITIMKDNFQGPTQYNVITSHKPASVNFPPNIQPAPWASQMHQQKPDSSYDKKLYDERKYSSGDQMKHGDIQKSDSYKTYDKNREVSPQRRMGRSYNRMGSPERYVSPPGRQMAGRISPGRRVSPSGRLVTARISPERRMSPSARQMAGRISLGRRDSPGRQMSGRISPGRRMSPTGRQMTGRISPNKPIYPSGRIISQERRISPSSRSGYPNRRSPERRGSPSRSHNTERRYSPSSRPIPSGRLSPSRNISPPRKNEYIRGRNSPPSNTPIERERERPPARGIPPQGRHPSPERQSNRYSPTRHHAATTMEYQEHRPNIKNVRPAYEPPVQASNEAKYSGGYRPNVRDDVPYSVRGQEQRWQEKDYSQKNHGEDRREVIRLQKFDIPRASEQERSIEEEPKRSRSHNRSSRSPRRDRSPIRDRYRHSPSSRSPRRSWALEKRRSPEMREPPPPPIWPGQDAKSPDYQRQGGSKFVERDQEKTSAIWISQDKKRDEFIRQRNADRESFEEEMRRCQNSGKWKLLPQNSPKETSRYMEDDRMTREEKFRRKEFEERREFSRRDDDRQLTFDRRNRETVRLEREGPHSKPDYEMKDDILRKKDLYSNRIEDKKKEILKKQEQLQKEIDEVYKRAVDFTKKAELYRKVEGIKESNYKSSRGLDEDHYSSGSDERHNDYPQKGRKQVSKSHSLMNDPKDYNSPHSSDEIKKKVDASVPAVKTKRRTAVEQIAEKIFKNYGRHLPNDLKRRVCAELELSVSRILLEMFGNEDVSFIELVIKFNSSHSVEDEEKIFDDVMSHFPTHYRRPKRSAKDDSGIPAKTSRNSGETNVSQDGPPIVHDRISDWNVLSNVAASPQLHIGQVTPAGILMGAPVMVPLPAPYQFLPAQIYQENIEPIVSAETNNETHSLYLCKDDFQPITEYETAHLKNFLVQQVLKVTQTSRGWAPDFTLAKQQSTHRHEMLTRDERSRDWLLGLDFSEFENFNVLVYTTEELWYERAAVWLPGHSRYRNIDPLTKLKLQNKQLEGVNIGKWKFVKKVLNAKGTRVYVDMPSSSARALEKHKMQLSYELLKVNVFMKALAIDKEAFDAGLNEPSVKVLPGPSMTPMPSIVGQDKNMIKIAFKGNKPLTLVLARKVSDTIIYKMYKHHQLDGKSRTDFIKYGFCQPGYFCLVPENEESKKWICNLDLGKINHKPLIVVGADEARNKYFNMKVLLPKDIAKLPKHAFERLRQSNKGVKGINFNLWKNFKLLTDYKHNHDVLNVDMDLESIETIANMKYRLDFLADNREYVVDVDSNLPRSKMDEMIARYKSELSDKYDVANMDIASDSDDDIICLD